MHLPSALCSCFAAGVATSTVVIGQCPLAWQRAAPNPWEVRGTVLAVREWDPDGPGPLQPVVVVAGELVEADGQPAQNVMLFDPVARTWAGAGGVFQGAVTALAIDANGDLIAGGNFTHINGQSVRGLARRNNGVWSEIGGGVAGAVAAVAALPAGGVVVAGSITAAGTPSQAIPVNRIALWDGFAWSAMGGGVTGAPLGGATAVQALVVDGFGRLAVGGNFASAAGTPCENVAYWQNGIWSSLPSLPSVFPPAVSGLAVTADNRLLVVGSAFLSGPQMRVWDGVAWTVLAPPPGSPTGVAVLPDGSWIITALLPTFFTQSEAVVARWSGGGWQTLARTEPFGILWAVAPVPSVGGDAIAVGGSYFALAGLESQSFGMRLQGVWQGNTPALVRASSARMGLGDRGELVALASAVQGQASGGVARWDGSSWQPLAFPGPGLDAEDVAVLADGSLAVCGSTFGVMRQAANGAWVPLAGASVPVRRLLAMPDGRLMAYNTGLQVWNGAAWSNLQPLGRSNQAVVAVSKTRSGQWLVGGPRLIARYDGTVWTDLDPNRTGPSNVVAITELLDGSVAVADDRLPGRVFRGVQGVWSMIGQADGELRDLQADASGKLYVAGNFSTMQGVAANRLAVWSGGAWSNAGGSLLGTPQELVLHPNGDVWVSGVTYPSRVVARLATPCPSLMVETGTGCLSGSGRLTVDPWLLLGERSSLLASALPQNGIVVFGYGFLTTNQTLTLGANNTPDCVLHVLPESTTWRVAGPWTATELVIPNAAGLLGTALLAQAVGLDPAPPPGGSMLKATNSLLLVVGSRR